MKIQVPEKSLILLIGPSGSGKSTFARRLFRPTEILSSDAFRAMLCDDENAQYVSGQAFDLLHQACDKRMHFDRLTVVDATNLRSDARKPFLNMAQHRNYPVIAFVFHLPESVYLQNDQARPGRHSGPNIVRKHLEQLRQLHDLLPQEGYQQIVEFTSLEQLNAVQIERELPALRMKHWTGPIDLIGDVHGCLPELKLLLQQLGYLLNPVQDIDEIETWDITHPEGRKLVFVGDLVDRGPDTPGVLRLVSRAMQQGQALCVMGNHDQKLVNHLRGSAGKIPGGLQLTLQQMEMQPNGFRERIFDFLQTLPDHLILDDGKLVVAHAGLKESLHGKSGRQVRDFALYGDTNGQMDEHGFPIRFNWAAEYQGTALVVYGHVPIEKLEFIHQTVCIDTGCVFGGELSALRYPERTFVQVNCLAKYWDTKSRIPSIWDLPQRSNVNQNQPI